MPAQASLFDVSSAGRTPTLPVRPAARQSDPSTSHEAAGRVAPHRQVLALAILDVLERAPACGDEVWAHMPDRDDGTVKSAISRLKAQGLVVAAGRRAPFGLEGRCAQTVVAITVAGRQWLRHAAEGRT